MNNVVKLQVPSPRFSSAVDKAGRVMQVIGAPFVFLSLMFTAVYVFVRIKVWADSDLEPGINAVQEHLVADIPAWKMAAIVFLLAFPFLLGRTMVFVARASDRRIAEADASLRQ